MAFTCHKGHGGTVLVGAATWDGVTKWTLNKKGRLADITHSGTGGVVRRKKTVTDGDGTVEFIWDSTNIPDTDVTLDHGDEVALVLFVGDSTKSYSFNAVVDVLTLVDDETQDVVRGTLTFFANGPFTDPIT